MNNKNVIQPLEDRIADMPTNPTKPDNTDLPGGVVHQLPEDLQDTLTANSDLAKLWKGLTPLGRNEFICWITDAKKAETRARRISRTQEELLEGKRRPCCWPGCSHREKTGKAQQEL